MNDAAKDPGGEPPAPGGEPLTPSVQTLVKYALPVVARAADDTTRRYPGRGKPQELYAVGTFALYRIAGEFRGEMSHDFADLAYRRVRDGMRDALKLERKQDRRRRAAEKGGDLFLAFLRDDEYNVLWHDDADAARRLDDAADALLAATFAAVIEQEVALQAEDPAAEEEEYRGAIEALGTAVQALPEEQAQTLKLVYRDGKTVAEVGRALGLSYRTVQRRHADALMTLRDELGKLGVNRAPPSLDLNDAGEGLGAPDSTDTARDP
jgi:RNA polymerase sigma factor (sigma-70 family)